MSSKKQAGSVKKKNDSIQLTEDQKQEIRFVTDPLGGVFFAVMYNTHFLLHFE